MDNLEKMMTSLQAAMKWNLTKRQVNSLCANGKIDGAVMEKNRWWIPVDYEYTSGKDKLLIECFSPKFFVDSNSRLRYENADDSGRLVKDRVKRGMYINTGNEGFKSIRKSEYVDKSSLISIVNSHLDSTHKLMCVTRPRRFGKSYAVKMLNAYYCMNCDSKLLFNDLQISNDKSYEEHLNKYNVLYLDITLFLSILDRDSSFVRSMERKIIEDMENYYGFKSREDSLLEVISRVNEISCVKMILLIDEWDAILRECKDQKDIIDDYINLLQGLFKSSLTDNLFSCVYMTGILPIKKYGHQSAVSDFYEYSMLEPSPLERYIGFTSEEVEKLCAEHWLDFDEMKRWYDGYHFGEYEIFNPKSVMEAIFRNKCGNYWVKTESYEALRDFVDLNFDGLKDDIIDMLGGKSIVIDTMTFQNDLTSMNCADDVLTLLVHLGYLKYDDSDGMVSIPNYEIRDEFIRAIKYGNRHELYCIIKQSDALLNATWNMDSNTVAEIIDDIHNSDTASVFYNNEQALRSVIKMGYLCAADYYNRSEEVAAGKGFADMIFIPKLGCTKPAIIVELKWNKSAVSGVNQIANKNYAAVLSKIGYKGECLFVGINYDEKLKTHFCAIRKWTEGL